MKRITIPVVMRKQLVEEIELQAKKQGISRSRFIEIAVEYYLMNQKNYQPKTTKEKFIRWLLTGEEV